MSIIDLKLKNYRNLHHLHLTPNSHFNILIGNNGIGKTNILESMSLFSPGKGFLGNNFNSLQRIGSEDGWVVQALVSSYALLSLTTRYTNNKRTLELNASNITSKELLKIIAVTWLIPIMETLFVGPASERRKFLDHTASLLDYEHPSGKYKYDYYLKERLRILTTGTQDNKWLTSIEHKIAKEASKIANARLKTISLLQRYLDDLGQIFAPITIAIEGTIEQQAQKINEDELTEWVAQQLKYARQQDAQYHRTHIGVHRSDLQVIFKKKNMPVMSCSMGEQKAALIALIMAQTYLNNDEEKSKILLLDEVFVHLDLYYRHALAELLLQLKSQIWITSTDLSHLGNLANYTEPIFLDA